MEVKCSDAFKLKCPKDLAFLDRPQFTKRAGIIPYFIYRDVVYLVLGIDSKSGDVADFGGGCRRDATPITCALRELREETRGAIRVNPSNITHIVLSNVNHEKSRVEQTILFVKIAPVNEYDINERFQRTRGLNSSHYEMNRIIIVPYKNFRYYNIWYGLRQNIDILDNLDL